MVESRVTMEDFTLLKMIGKGSYGKVLLVKKNDTEEVFAMKMLKKDYIARRNQIDHTRTERSILEKVNHPYIVKLRYAFQNPKKLYFVLEYCPGGELFFHLSRAGKFEEPRAQFYAACVLLAIEHLHSQNIVYRDLKPENILIDSQGYAKITDFGLSKENILDNTSARTFCGTPEYLAPEVLLKQGHGKAVDWWSLGALIFEMLTGLPPFYNAKDRERMFQDIMQSEVRFPAFISQNARSLLEHLFVKDPVARLGAGPRDAEEIKEHPWFASINWARMLNREEIPPFVPALEGIYDTKYVDSEFTVMPAVDSVANEAHFEASSPTYQNFSYISSSLQK